MSHAPCFGWRCFLQSIIPKDFSLCTNTLADSVRPMVTDSGWQNATLIDFTEWAAGTPVRYRKSGNVVQIAGQVKAKTTGATNLFSLPTGYYPL